MNVFEYLQSIYFIKIITGIATMKVHTEFYYHNISLTSSAACFSYTLFAKLTFTTNLIIAEEMEKKNVDLTRINWLNILKLYFPFHFCKIKKKKKTERKQVTVSLKITSICAYFILLLTKK